MHYLNLIGAILFSLLTTSLSSQVNIYISDAQAEMVLQGVYDPADYQASTVIDDHEQILCELESKVNPDSLESYLRKLTSFHTRNTLSDTLSAVHGIGAARRWAFQWFEQVSAANDNRLQVSYVGFDWLNGRCGDGFDLRNVIAVLPGRSVIDHQLIVMEAHMDAMCDNSCDTACRAPGADDNASGSALVMELARVLSEYTFDHTLVFMLTVGEEQGLQGAHAMATYCVDNNIAIKAVQNNDIVGGVICGPSSSPPSCPNPGEIDSTHVRIFSDGSLANPNRNYARTIKMFYQEKMMAEVSVPMGIEIQNQEDRTGRGGDHIPFRQRGYRSIRFNNSHEHGSGAGPGNQHSSDDSLGIDTDFDGQIDSFFVQKTYLARNTVINAMGTVLTALGPQTPEFILHDEPTGLRVSITSQHQLPEYRIAVRNPANIEFDAVYRTTDTSFVVPGLTAGQLYAVSVAGIDAQKIMSPFSGESLKQAQLTTNPQATDPLPYAIACVNTQVEEPISALPSSDELGLIAFPNPGRGHISMVYSLPSRRTYESAAIVIRDRMGRQVERFEVSSQAGDHTYTYSLEHLSRGIYIYYLELNSTPVAHDKLLLQ